jgi:hypothetical protein
MKTLNECTEFLPITFNQFTELSEAVLRKDREWFAIKEENSLKFINFTRRQTVRVRVYPASHWTAFVPNPPADTMFVVYAPWSTVPVSNFEELLTFVQDH